MSLRKEVQEELEEQAYREGERQIIEKYYTDPDEEMRSFGSSMLHRTVFGEYEPTPEQKRSMELELQIYRMKHGRSNG